jgi:hypothetical protein
MTEEEIRHHFNLPRSEIARIFGTTRRHVHHWSTLDQVPEVVSLRADYMTGGALKHDPEKYGAKYKRGQYKRPADLSHS